MGKKQQIAQGLKLKQERLVTEQQQRTIESLQHALAEANQRAQRSARDVDWYRERESARARIAHAEKQLELKQQERDERRKRIEQLGQGLLPLKDTVEWSITHEEGGRSGIEVFVPLAPGELNAAQGYLEGRSKGLSVPAYRALFDEVRVQGQINRMVEAQRRLQRLYV